MAATPIPMDDGKARQNCATCRFQKKCYSTKTSGGNSVNYQNVAINILICRIKMGIDPDRSAVNLLRLLKPGIINLVSRMRNNASSEYINFDEVTMEASSKAIEYLVYDYDIGDFLVATAYLFSPMNGYLNRWAQTYVNRMRKFSAHHKLYSDFQSDPGDTTTDEVPTHVKGYGDDSVISQAMRHEQDDSSESKFVVDTMAIIDDGVTLSANEHRVLRFCMANANELNSHRHIDGLHLQLAVLMGVSRPRITRLYKRARQKIVQAYQQTEAGQS